MNKYIVDLHVVYTAQIDEIAKSWNSNNLGTKP